MKKLTKSGERTAPEAEGESTAIVFPGGGRPSARQAFRYHDNRSLHLVIMTPHGHRFDTGFPAEVFLRTGDALHLGCARENGFKDVYTNDRHMLAGAPLFGLRGIDVIR